MKSIVSRSRQYAQTREPTTEGYPYIPHRASKQRGVQVIQQGNRRLVVHQGLPPPKEKPRKPRLPRLHPLVYIGVGVIVCCLLILLKGWWSGFQDERQYGYPRMSKMDADVGHGGMSHFIFLNLTGQILVRETINDKSSAYLGSTFVGDGSDKFPVTGTFKDMNNDEKIDMIVTVNGQEFVYFNDGMKFVVESEEK